MTTTSAGIVKICNGSLALIGHKELITSLDDNTEAARLCKMHWDMVRDAVLRAHPWNCATARAELAADADPPAFGFSYQYKLPRDPVCLKVRRMQYTDQIYKVEGKMLLTDENPARIVFTQQLTEIGEWDALLKQAMEGRIAAKIAFPLTNSTSLVKAMWGYYTEVLEEAQTVDAQEGSPDEFESDEWITARE